MTASTPKFGLIEGFYGRPWTPQARAETLSFLRPHGYCAYLYAPKADAFLRRRWREPFPDDHARSLAGLAAHCRGLGVSFGVGLSPYELYRQFDDAAKADLARKLAELAALGVQELAILFDDMRGDLPDLAAAQVRIMDWIASRAGGARIIFCPTYYSDDPLLDRAFGQRPPSYLEDLGVGLDPAIDVFWTGEEVCSRAIGVGHLQRVNETLRRAPVLWDNYPVNDGPVMSQSLHLRAFTGRPAEIAPLIASHMINPASQAVLSRIPALSLAESYERGGDYDYGAALVGAAEAVLGSELAARVRGDLWRLQDSGLDRLSETARTALRERYAAFAHPGAREIVDWLDGAWAITREEIEAS